MSLRLFELFCVGGAAGMIGSLVGLGGGFLAVPVLRTLFSVAPVSVSGAALVMVLANACSASIAYLRQRRIDVRAGIMIAATGIPTSILGAMLVRKVPAAGFDLLYGALLVYLAIDIVRKKVAPQAPPTVGLITEEKTRVLKDAFGTEYHYRENTPLLLGAGLLMGFSSSFFGIGGGLIVIPVLLFLGAPTHIVTATSAFAILLTSPVGVITHQAEHDIDWSLALPLAAGGIIGGQIGPRMAKHLSSPRLLSLIAITLLGAAIALIFRHIQ